MTHARPRSRLLIAALMAVVLLALASSSLHAQAGGAGTIVRGEIPPDGGFGLIVFGGGSFS